jgi:maltoporin
MQLIGRIILASCNFVYSLICTYVLKEGFKRTALITGMQLTNLSGWNAGRQKYIQAEVQACIWTGKQIYRLLEVQTARQPDHEQADVQAGKLTGTGRRKDEQTYGQVEVQACRNADRRIYSLCTGRQKYMQAEVHAGRRTGMQMYRQANLQAARSTDSQAARPRISRRTGRQTIGQADFKINKHTGRQTYRRANIQTVNRIGRQTYRQPDVQTSRSTGRQTYRQANKESGNSKCR